MGVTVLIIMKLVVGRQMRTPEDSGEHNRPAIGQGKGKEEEEERNGNQALKLSRTSGGGRNRSGSNGTAYVGD